MPSTPRKEPAPDEPRSGTMPAPPAVPLAAVPASGTTHVFGAIVPPAPPLPSIAGAPVPMAPASAPKVEVAMPRPPASAPKLEVPSPRAPSASGNWAALGPTPKKCPTCGTAYPEDFLVCPRDASPLVTEGEESDDPLVGKIVGDAYQIVRVVGEGGMGRVYEARHLRLKERRFAVKVLHGDLARNPDIVARFQREAESASSIAHPNVVDVFDVHRTSDGEPYLVAEFLEGVELAEFVKSAPRGRLAPEVASLLVSQVCRALSAAHDKDIIHRDMKPENVFVLTQDGVPHVKVLDFGISKAKSEGTNLTRTGMIMGTPSYMAPEQARGEPVDRRADVYSTGAVLYFAITGKRPFDSDDPTVTMTMVLTRDPERPRAIDPTIPEGLELVIQRSMAKDPKERYESMAELESALAPFAGTLGGALAAYSGGAALAAAPLPRLDTAQTILAGIAAATGGGVSTPPPSSAENLARIARPTVVILSSALGAWLAFGFVAALAGVVRAIRGGELTLTECLLLIFGTLLAAATPGTLFVLHVKRVVWPSTVKAVRLAADLRRTAIATFAFYGALTLTARIAYTVILRETIELGGGWWDVAFFVLSIIGATLGGGAGPLLRSMRRRT